MYACRRDGWLQVGVDEGSVPAVQKRGACRTHHVSRPNWRKVVCSSVARDGATRASWCRLLAGVGVGHARLVREEKERKRLIGLLVLVGLLACFGSDLFWARFWAYSRVT